MPVIIAYNKFRREFSRVMNDIWRSIVKTNNKIKSASNKSAKVRKMYWDVVKGLKTDGWKFNLEPYHIKYRRYIVCNELVQFLEMIKNDVNKKIEYLNDLQKYIKIPEDPNETFEKLREKI
jgi:hypothetical protein